MATHKALWAFMKPREVQSPCQGTQHRKPLSEICYVKPHLTFTLSPEVLPLPQTQTPALTKMRRHSLASSWCSWIVDSTDSTRQLKTSKNLQ